MMRDSSLAPAQLNFAKNTPGLFHVPHSKNPHVTHTPNSDTDTDPDPDPHTPPGPPLYLISPPIITTTMQPDLHSLTTTILLFLALNLAATVALASTVSTTVVADLPEFQEAPEFRNGKECNHHDPSIIHIAMTLDTTYLRGSIAGVFSVLQHATCPENIVFHFLSSTTTHRRNSADLRRTILTTFPYLSFHLHHFDTNLVKNKISSSIRRALDQPLNYARIYLADLIPISVNRIIYFDSDLIVVDDIANLWSIDLKSHVLGAPEYCHANFTSYFTNRFWSIPIFSTVFSNRNPCYFNTGVMVIDLQKWRQGKYTEKLENWMRLQKRYRIYELGSLPPFLLVFAGNVESIEHRWNQHGLGGDNVQGLCRDLHPGPVSLLHWSGKGKPWLRLDSKKPCPLDSLWAPYDLFRHAPLFSDS